MENILLKMVLENKCDLITQLNEFEILNFYWISQQQNHSKFNISNNLGLKIAKSPL